MARLNALTPLTSVVGGQIYWSDASQQMVLPCVVCSVTSRDWNHNLAGASGESTAEFTFDAMAYTQAQALAIAQAIRLKASAGGLDGFAGFQSGIQFLRTFITDESDSTIPPASGSDNWTFVVSVTYQIVHYVPFPTSVTQTDT